MSAQVVSLFHHQQQDHLNLCHYILWESSRTSHKGRILLDWDILSRGLTSQSKAEIQAPARLISRQRLSEEEKMKYSKSEHICFHTLICLGVEVSNVAQKAVLVLAPLVPAKVLGEPFKKYLQLKIKVWWWLSSFQYLLVSASVVFQKLEVVLRIC